MVLDADRDAATADACLETEIGQPVRTNIDAEFNRVGEVLAIANRISGPATLLETTLTLLDAEVMLPAAHRSPRLDGQSALPSARPPIPWSCDDPIPSPGPRAGTRSLPRPQLTPARRPGMGASDA